jgi:ATP-binding cassette subfamily B protein
VQAWLGWDSPWAWADRYEYCLLVLLGSLLISAAVEALLLLVASRLSESAAWDAANALQVAICTQARRLDRPEWFAGEGGVPEERLLTACRKVRQGLATWWKILARGVSLLAVLGIMLLCIDFFLMLLAILLAIFLWNIYQRLTTRADSTAQHHASQVELRRNQLLDLIRTLRIESSTGAEGSSEETVRATIDRYRQAAQPAMAGPTSLRPWLLLLGVCGAALLLLVVGLSPRPHTWEISILAAGVARLLLPWIGFHRVWATIRRCEKPAAEIFAFLDQRPAVGQMAGATDLGRIESDFRWDRISVGSGTEQPLLADVSLSVPAKTLAAFAFSEPRLKRVVASLCLRYTDPDSGCIFADGRDLRSLTLASVRKQIAFAAADGGLLTGTVEDNIRCGRPGYTQADIERAADLCQVSELVRDLPQGFQTTIGSRGRTIAPSAAFQIGLARAVLGGPSLIVVDEPTEPQDEESGRAIDAALEQVRTNHTLIVFASRLSTLRAADRVYLFHQGKLQAQATHTELLQQDALYRHLNYLLSHPFRDLESQAAG